MRQKLSAIIFFLFVLSYRNSFAQDTKNSVQPFLPEIISQFPNVRDVAISPSEKEVYFSAQSFLGELSSIVFVNSVNDKWSKPEIAKFSGKYNDLEPFFSPDGLKMYFASNRPHDKNSTETKDYDIWFVTRKDVNAQWSDPINIGAPINTKDDEFYPSVSANGNLYFTSTGHQSKGKDDIFVSKYINNIYQVPASVSDSVNTAGYEFNAFISPDESFMVFTGYGKKDGLGSGDLYISYKKQNGDWTIAVNLSKEINSVQMDYCPFINTKTGTLYFTSRRSNVNPKLNSNQNINTLLTEINKYDNGQSRLYSVNFSKWLRK